MPIPKNSIGLFLQWITIILLKIRSIFWAIDYDSYVGHEIYVVGSDQEFFLIGLKIIVYIT